MDESCGALAGRPVAVTSAAAEAMAVRRANSRLLIDVRLRLPKHGPQMEGCGTAK